MSFEEIFVKNKYAHRLINEDKDDNRDDNDDSSDFDFKIIEINKTVVLVSSSESEPDRNDISCSPTEDKSNDFDFKNDQKEKNEEVTKPEDSFDETKQIKSDDKIDDDKSSSSSVSPIPGYDEKLDLYLSNAGIKKRHQKVQPCECDVCGRKFKRFDYLRKHKNSVHFKIKRFECDYCGKKVVTKISLAYHITKLHPGKKPPEIRIPKISEKDCDDVECYTCEKCGKNFNHKRNLYMHINIMHNDEPVMYTCSICSKEFKHKTSYNLHKVVHSKVKSYICPHCGKSFTQSSSLNAHVKTIHDPKRIGKRKKKTGKINS